MDSPSRFLVAQSNLTSSNLGLEVNVQSEGGWDEAEVKDVAFVTVSRKKSAALILDGTEWI